MKFFKKTSVTPINILYHLCTYNNNNNKEEEKNNIT